MRPRRPGRSKGTARGISVTAEAAHDPKRVIARPLFDHLGRPHKDVSDMARPIALAVTGLTTRANRGGCSTGISTGFTPVESVDHVRGAPERVLQVWAARHQTLHFDELPKAIHGW